MVFMTEADLRIGELQWGDSGVYFCKVVIADDLEGKNEAQLELLVLGKRSFHYHHYGESRQLDGNELACLFGTATVHSIW